MFPDNTDESPIPSLRKAAEIIGLLGEELAFVAPNQDAGILPINRFIMDIEEFPEGDVPPFLTAGLKVARAWLDQTLDGPGKFTEETIRNFNMWHAWMTSVLLAWQTGRAMPAWPEGWAGTDRADDASEADEPSIRLNLAEDLALLREFHGESVELLQSIEQGVLVLEENPTHATTIDSIFRAFHTFKGGAGFLHLDAMRDLAHDLESLFDEVRYSRLSITSEIIDLILAGADALKRFTREIGAQLQGTDAGAPILVPTQQIIARVQSALRGAPLQKAASATEAVVEPLKASQACWSCIFSGGNSLAENRQSRQARPGSRLCSARPAGL